MVFAFEREALQNAPIPEDCKSPPDVFMFLTLRALYQQHRAGTLDREQAAAEKRKLESMCYQMRLRERLYTAHCGLQNRIDGACHEWRRLANSEDVGARLEAAEKIYNAFNILEVTA